jgi:hypothetical protein
VNFWKSFRVNGAGGSAQISLDPSKTKLRSLLKYIYWNKESISLIERRNQHSVLLDYDIGRLANLRSGKGLNELDNEWVSKRKDILSCFTN